VVAVAAGGFHNLALHANGTLSAWGGNNYGETNIAADLTNIVAVACGRFHNVVLRDDGTVTAWGANYSGQSTVPAGLSNVVAVAAGNAIGFALRTDGTITGLGSGFNVSSIPAISNVVAVSGSAGTGAALLPDGSIVPWGNSSETNWPAALPPAIAVTTYAPFNQVGGSWALLRDRTLAGCGPFLGDTNIWQSLSNVTSIASGYYHHVALIDDTPQATTPVAAGAFNDGAFSLDFPTERGSSYHTEYTRTFSNQDWTMLLPIPGDGTVQSVTDHDATDPFRFYRVVRRH
jgi:alpha-tubulin suppressor-like RCC1 family protein